MYAYIQPGDDANEGILSSPGFPSSYPNNFLKTYKITASRGPIDISFSHLNTEKCCDFVSIEDEDGTVLLENTSGNSVPGNITSRTNAVIVKFRTDHGSVGTGWQLKWEGKHGLNTDKNQFCECCVFNLTKD